MTKLTGALLVLGVIAQAQQPDAFEAATIRQNRSGSANTNINISGGRLTVVNASLKTLVRNGWDLLSFQLADGPSWFDTEMFDITATAGDGQAISGERFRLLLRGLLEDRFRLRVHREMRPGSIYALTVAPGGTKLKQDMEPGEPGINTRKGPGAARMQGTRQTMAILAQNLGNQLGRFVADSTGLTAKYDWVLEWDPDSTAESELPSLFTAVQQQLGLKLVPQKGASEVLVVDSAQEPSEN